MAAHKLESGLTVKQEAFARAYVECGDARKAYELAGYSQKNSLESQRVEACRLLQNPNVSLMVRGLMEGHAKRHQVTVDTINEMLKEDRELARQNAQSSAAVAATMGMAKVNGLIWDKIKGDPDAPVMVTQVQMVVVDADPAQAEDDEHEVRH